MYIKDDCCGYDDEPCDCKCEKPNYDALERELDKARLQLKPAEDDGQIKKGKPNDSPVMMPFKSFMDLACNYAKINLIDFFTLCTKLTDFDKDNNQGWLYTEDNMALYDKNMPYFSLDEHGYYPVGDIEIFINTYGCINDLTDYLYNCFVHNDRDIAENVKDSQKSNAYFSDKLDELYNILGCIRAKFIAIITAFQPDNRVVKNIINIDNNEDRTQPGHMIRMNQLLMDMTNIHLLIFTLAVDILGFETPKEVKND